MALVPLPPAPCVIQPAQQLAETREEGSVIVIRRNWQLDDMDLDSSSSYKPEASMSPLPAPRKKAKGKQKAITTADDSDDMPLLKLAPPKPVEKVSKSKDRRSPKPTGKTHTPACELCQKRGIACQEEVGGGSCVLCMKGKTRCDYALQKATRPTIRHRKDSRPTEATVQKRRVKKSMPYVEVSDEESQEVTVRPQVPAPAPMQSPAPIQMPETMQTLEHGKSTLTK
jgi:hypothetical protein